MNASIWNILVSPKTHEKLTLQITQEMKGEIREGVLLNESGERYEIIDFLPDMVPVDALIGDSKFARSYYTEISSTYDENLHVTFDLYNDDEVKTRDFMIELLNLGPSSRVLEVSAGTGKDSQRILEKLGADGHLVALDLTPAMLHYARNNIMSKHENIDFVVGTATALPFADNTFDALYCFAGVGHFPDIPKALDEMARVVKVGGKVVFCEKNVPPWLRNTEYGKILINNNPMFAYDIPLKHIPVSARDLGVHWILGNVHYVIDYTVGDGEPEGNFDLKLPGSRGGTFNTRYYGKLEGVTPETKDLAMRARNKLDISMHQWLDDLIKREARKILEK